MAGAPGDLGRDLFAEVGRGVKTGSDRSASDGQTIQPLKGLPDQRQRVLKLRGVAGPLLAHRERRRVLKVCAPDLNDIHPLARFRLDGVRQGSHCGNEAIAEFEHSRDVHGRWKRVVGRLAHIHVVIRVNWALAAEYATYELDRPIADDLVYVHV